MYGYVRNDTVSTVSHGWYSGGQRWPAADGGCAVVSLVWGMFSGRFYLAWYPYL